VKCRVADDLVHLVERDPALTDLRDELPGLSLRQRISRVSEGIWVGAPSPNLIRCAERKKRLEPLFSNDWGDLRL